MTVNQPAIFSAHRRRSPQCRFFLEFLSILFQRHIYKSLFTMSLWTFLTQSSIIWHNFPLVPATMFWVNMLAHYLKGLLQTQGKFLSHSALLISVLFRNAHFSDPVRLNQLWTLPSDHFHFWPSSLFSPIQCSAPPTYRFRKFMSFSDSMTARVAPSLEQEFFAKIQLFVVVEIK